MSLQSRINAILIKTARAHDLDLAALIRGGRHTRRCVIARTEAIRQLRDKLKLPWVEIGAVMNCDHSTALHSYNAIVWSERKIGEPTLLDYSERLVATVKKLVQSEEFLDLPQDIQATLLADAEAVRWFCAIERTKAAIDKA